MEQERHPWERVKLSDYEEHMSLAQVYQLQTLNQIMKEQIGDWHGSGVGGCGNLQCSGETAANPAVAILGVAGGNGLEHGAEFPDVLFYGIDINRDYLEACKQRHPYLGSRFIPMQADLSAELSKKQLEQLGHWNLVIANLFIEYVGIEAFGARMGQIKPDRISCVIQVNPENSFVSESPYIHCFDEISDLHKDVAEEGLDWELSKQSYQKEARKEYALPNGKVFVRLDYRRM